MEVIKFKQSIDWQICTANIFYTESPYTTFLDESWKMIGWTGFEFNTSEMIGNSELLKDLTINFIKEKWWTLLD